MRRFKNILFIIVIVLLSVAAIWRYVELNTGRYIVNSFNDKIKINSMSVYNDGVYYYTNDGGIYELSDNNESRCLIEAEDISGICALESYVYYISKEKIFRCDIEKKTSELLDEDAGYKYIASDEKNVYALCYVNGNYTDYKVLQINNNDKYTFSEQNNSGNERIGIFDHGGDYKYFCNNTKYKSFCGVVNENNSVVFRSNDMINNNLLFFDDKIIITSDENGDQLLIHNQAGDEMDKINIPDGYAYIPQNVFSDDKYIYMLIQAQNGYNAIGCYNLSQKRHKSDAIVKYDIENKSFSFIYETNNKYERILGYKDDTIICLHNNYLYSLNVNSGKKERIAKIKADNAEFEICFDRIFVWNDKDLIGDYSILI